jgi:hypothetical protein
MKFTLDSKFGALLEDAQARVIIEKYLPGISTHPMIGFVKGMTLSGILAIPQAVQQGLTREKVEQVLAEINQAVE